MAIQTIQVFGQGCLSRAIVSHQGHSVAGVNDEIDPIQGRLSIRVTVGEGADLKKRGRSSIHLTPWCVAHAFFSPCLTFHRFSVILMPALLCGGPAGNLRSIHT